MATTRIRARRSLQRWYDAVIGSSLSAEERATLVRRGILLSYFTIAYNSLEAVVSLVAGLLSGSVALVGFGLDSVIEVTSSGAVQWRLRGDVDPHARERMERRTLRIVGSCFLALAVYVAGDSLHALLQHEHAARTVSGIVILALSVIVMPLLARRKRAVGMALGSRSLSADATQTSLCAWLSAIALSGVVLNAALGWWWADPAAALLMTPIIANEGVQAFRGEVTCTDCC